MPGAALKSSPRLVHELRLGDVACVRVATLGCRIVDLIVPDREGRPTDVAVGFDASRYASSSTSTADSSSAPDHRSNQVESHFCDDYFGATCGRVANRIAGAQYVEPAGGADGEIGQTVRLTMNEPGRGGHLHGGTYGFHAVVWTVVDVAETRLQLRYKSKDGEEGYPGDLDVLVTFELRWECANEQNAVSLQISYEATNLSETARTPVNLTNHSFFNLQSDHTVSVLDTHELEIRADSYLPVFEDTLVPTGVLHPVDDTSFDFRTKRMIGQGGYDHCYVLGSGGAGKVVAPSLTRAATLSNAASGIMMETWTDTPGMQLYTGSFLEDMRGKKNMIITKHCAVCLETQHFPNAVNAATAAQTLGKQSTVFLHPLEKMLSRTEYRFSTFR
eukprot:g14385.t1